MINITVEELDAIYAWLDSGECYKNNSNWVPSYDELVGTLIPAFNEAQATGYVRETAFGKQIIVFLYWCMENYEDVMDTETKRIVKEFLIAHTDLELQKDCSSKAPAKPKNADIERLEKLKNAYSSKKSVD